MEFITFGLGAVASNIIGQATQAITGLAAERLEGVIGNRSIDPGHDVERAILSAHCLAMKFVIEGINIDGKKRASSLDPYSPNSINAITSLRIRIEKIGKGEFEQIAADLATNWREVVPSTFPNQDRDLGELNNHISAALKDLRSLTTWTEKNWVIVEEAARDKRYGWAPLFKAKLHEALKKDSSFREIYSAYVLKSHSDQIDQILDLLGPDAGLESWIQNITSRLEKIEAGILRNGRINEDTAETIRNVEETVNRIAQNLDSSISTVFVHYLAGWLAREGVPKDKYEATIELALHQYLSGLKYLGQHQNSSPRIETKRQEAITLFQSGRLDEAEFVLDSLIEDPTESYRRELNSRANLLADRAAISAAKMDIIGSMEFLKRAAGMIFEVDEAQAWSWLIRGGEIGRRHAEITGDRYPLEYAIDLFHQALQITANGSPQRHPAKGRAAEWSQTQNFIGSAHKVAGDWGDEESMVKAVASFRDALKHCIRNNSPLDWSMIQNNLGNALVAIGSRGYPEALEQGVSAFRAALTERTRERAPAEWAETQSNLGVALVILGEQGNTEALRESITLFRSILNELSAESSPFLWATIQNNLGHALIGYGGKGDEGALNEGLIAMRKALKVWTREKAAYNWAGVQLNMGNALSSFGKGGRIDSLLEGIEAYRLALEVWTVETAPTPWAKTLNNLGSALVSLGEQTGEKVPILEGIESYRSSLAVRTRDRAPFQWANTKHNLGNALMVLGGYGDAEAVLDAISSYQDALNECSEETEPLLYATTKTQLALAFVEANRSAQAKKHFRDAELVYQRLSCTDELQRLHSTMRSCGIDVVGVH